VASTSSWNDRRVVLGFWKLQVIDAGQVQPMASATACVTFPSCARGRMLDRDGRVLVDTAGVPAKSPGRTVCSLSLRICLLADPHE